jgi:hypothetical protein
MSLVSAEDLREIVRSAQADKASLSDTADGWLYWFSKRGDRCIKDAAKLGYTEITMDLPIEIAQSIDRASLLTIQKGVKELLAGCFVGFVEDEYEGKPLCRLLIRWTALAPA